MKKTVLTYGLISGVVAAALMLLCGAGLLIHGFMKAIAVVLALLLTAGSASAQTRMFSTRFGSSDQTKVARTQVKAATTSVTKAVKANTKAVRSAAEKVVKAS